jgi:hypothetical protein
MPNLCETPPDFTLPIYHSTDTFTLSAQTDKVILLSFMNLGCGHCWSWIPRWASLKTDYDLANVEVVTVIFNSGADDITDAILEAEFTARGLPEPNFTILKDSGGWGTVAPTYMSGFSAPPWFPYAYLISRSHKIANMWHWKSTEFGELVSFDSGDDNDVEAFIRHRFDDLLTDRPRWNTILTLDYSDSMDLHTTVAGVTKPKIEFLREAADSWLRVWKDYASCDDNLGLVRFGSNAISDGTLLPILPGANVEAILATLDTDTTGCTALGAGIATGIDILETDPIDPGDPHQRFMVVFTDGVQNRNPMFVVTADCGGGVCVWEPQIRQVSPDDVEFYGWTLCGPDGGTSDYAGTLPRVLEGNPMQTAIHTIGIGAPTAYQSLLTTLSDQTPGSSYLDSDIWPNLEEFFVESLVENFRGATLSVATKATGTLAAGETEHIETFRLNPSVRKATVLLSWLDPSAPLTFTLRKDGARLKLTHKESVRPTANVTTIPFPLYQPPLSWSVAAARALPTLAAPGVSAAEVSVLKPSGRMVEADGEYQLTIRRLFPDTAVDIPYHLMVLADDKDIEVELRLPKQRYFTNERIPIELLTTDRGRPLESVYSVTASIDRPETPFANLYVDHYRRLAKGKIPPTLEKDTLVGRFDTVVQKMFDDPDLAQKLRARHRETVRLEPSFRAAYRRTGGPKGVFGKKYTGTEVPGHYRIEARVRGVSPSAGVFERVVSKTVLVVPRPDLDRSKVQVSDKGKDRELVVTLTPADRNGNLLGPGYGSQLLFLLDDEVQGTVRDRLDGSYEIRVQPKVVTATQQRSKTQPAAALWIAGERIFSGSLPRLLENSKG